MRAKKLLLASGSPHRARLLSTAGFDFVQRAMDIDESFSAKLNVQQNVKRLAILKAQAAKKKNGNAFVILAADTVVVSSTNQVLTKARDAQQATEFLRARSGSFEHVISGYCLLSNDKISSGSATTKITYQAIPSIKQQLIISSGEWQGVCGGLKIEGLVRHYVKEIKGDRDNIIGLPMKLIAELLNEFEVVPNTNGKNN